MGIITTFNKAVSNAITKTNADYIAIIGTEEYTPEATIVVSEDINCGALCNELEYSRVVSQYYTQSFDLDIAEGENLDLLINAFIDLPRRDQSEENSVYRNRYRAIVNEKGNTSRTTVWAIRDAISYFLSTASSTVQVIERFDSLTNYFEIRIEGAVDYDDVMVLDSDAQGVLDQNFVGGEGIGAVISYLGEIIDRIKAVGVDYDIIFIRQDRVTKTSDSTIGSIQVYKTVSVVITATLSTDKTCDVVIV